jgi:hypothetical protein
MTESQNITIYDVLKGLELLPRHIDRISNEITNRQPKDIFKDIRETIESINKPVIPQKPPRSEHCLFQWKQFLKGKIDTLERNTVRYLCWEREAVEEPEFYKYIRKSIDRLSSREIKGLVTTIHLNWRNESHADAIVGFTLERLKRFGGRDRTIEKWKTGSEMLLGKSAAAVFARDVLLSSLRDIKSAAELWALNEESAFMRYAAVNAAEQAMGYFGQKSSITSYVLDHLLYWDGWKINAEGFRYIVKRLILHPRATSLAEDLRKKILTHSQLGDPRLPANRNKWIGIDAEARQKFIGWLARRDIVFFFDHVLKGRDVHGRREFWLRYVESMVSSRQLLSDYTAFEFRNNKDVSFGRLSSGSNKAAFVIDFGDVLAVEFSDVGCIYIYMKSEFERLRVDIWSSGPIREYQLKNQGIPDERRIIHRAIAKIVNVDWRNNAANVLARFGVRP